jgi:hypothetical protein
MAASILFVAYTKVDLEMWLLSNKRYCVQREDCGIGFNCCAPEKKKHKKSPTLLWDFLYLKNQELFFL